MSMALFKGIENLQLGLIYDFVLFCLVWFDGLSTIVDYLMPNINTSNSNNSI